MKERERVGKSLALGAAAGRRGGIAAFCGKQVPPNQTSSGKVYLVWIWSQFQSNGRTGLVERILGSVRNAAFPLIQTKFNRG